MDRRVLEGCAFVVVVGVVLREGGPARIGYGAVWIVMEAPRYEVLLGVG